MPGLSHVSALGSRIDEKKHDLSIYLETYTQIYVYIILYLFNNQSIYLPTHHSIE